MARIRSVKPEIRRSLTVAEWPREVRLAWIYLWMYLDDDGRGLDDMRLVVAELFPLDRDVTERKMNRWLDLMATTKTSESDVPPLCRYEVQERRYLHATGWSHQKINRPQDSRLPQCPIHERSVNDSRNDSVNGSVNDSLSDSPPSRAPADQGAGNREQGSREQGAGSATAQTIVGEWVDRCKARPPGQVVGNVAKLVGQMLTEGIDPDDIRRGLSAWMTKGLHPSTLPSVVNEVMNAPNAGRPTRRRDTDDKVRDGLALAQRLLAGQEEPTITGQPRQIGA